MGVEMTNYEWGPFTASVIDGDHLQSVAAGVRLWRVEIGVSISYGR